MGASLLLPGVCCLLLGLAVAVDGSESAKLLAHVNDVSSASDVGSKRQRSIYHHDYGSRYAGRYGEHGYSEPFEMHPPFAGRVHPSGEHLPLIHPFAKPEHNAGVKYAPKYKYKRPQYESKHHDYPKYPEHYAPPVYVPHAKPARHPDFTPSGDPFHEARQKVQAQFGHGPAPPHAAYPHPGPYPPPEYHPQPAPYAHEYPYPKHNEYAPPVPPYPHKDGRALEHFTFDPSPFIETIAVAYHENEKNFGVHRKGKQYEPAYPPPQHPGPFYRGHAGEYKPLVPLHGPPHVPEYRAPHVPEFLVPHAPQYAEPQHRGFAPAPPHHLSDAFGWPREHDKHAARPAPYPTQLGSLYSLAAASSHTSRAMDAVVPEGAAAARKAPQADGDGSGVAVPDVDAKAA